MKTLFNLLLFCLCASAIHPAFANDDKFKAAMIRNIRLVYDADSIPEYQEAANAFERIAQAEPTRWEPLYYSSFAYVMMSAREEDKGKRDVYLDKAFEAVTRAGSLSHDASEVAAMEGFIHMMRIPIDPATRGMTYAPKAMQAFDKAIALNENNPRALALKAQMEFGTAQFFGSGTGSACALNTRALEMFQRYVPENELAPVWGKGMAEGLEKQCK